MANTSQQDAPTRFSATRLLLSNEFGLLVLIVLFATIFATISPAFLSKFSLYALGRTSAVNIMIGFSMMVVIITGGLNLSVGAIGVSAAMFGGLLMENFGMPWPLAVVGGLAVGAGLGAINGIIIVRTGLHSFIITLATMSIFFGMMIFLTHAEILPRDFPCVHRIRADETVLDLLAIAAGDNCRRAGSFGVVSLYRAGPRVSRHRRQ